ncbi:N-terminal 7TM region of histidine kinase [Oscillospiraceae bacterium]|nr:N-terminal 7TM region of histidine kinase [Oscillospiraceae bacterium]
MIWYYSVLFVAAAVCTLIYAFLWHKHFDVNLTLMFLAGSISNLGYLMLADAQTAQEAILANKLSYFGACFGPLFIMLLIFNLCHIRLGSRLRKLFFTVSTVIYMSVLLTGKSSMFYEEIVFERKGSASWLTKTYGPMHTFFIATIAVYTFISFVVLIYSYIRKRDASRYMISLLFTLEVVAVAGYAARRFFEWKFETVPLAYALILVIFLFIVYRINLYDIDDVAIDSLVEKGITGFVSIDLKNNYLGSNDAAKKYFPQLNMLTVDRPVTQNAEFGEMALRWIDIFAKDQNKDKHHFDTEDGKIYLITVNFLFDGRRKRGYQLFISDDTREQKYVNLINSFNIKLSNQVKAKTKHIEAMHDKLIIGMAAMVESRDNSTGGHIKRTSEGVRILLDEIKKDPGFDLSEEFCKDLIKSAPMHDLGKIAVDDVILRKKGRFEPEEYEQMKKHAAEGARLIEQILEGTDNDSFQKVAVNVAHYHHERWDGSGYPEGLKGDQIPIEARIMAIADVYDALVSKRVYKEKFSFEKANEIIMEGMGTQFDKKLEQAYINSRPRLEEYYSSLGDE